MTSLCFKCCSNVKNIVNLLQISFLPMLYQACLTDKLKNAFLFVLKKQCMNVQSRLHVFVSCVVSGKITFMGQA